ncbi:hypothetical protein GWI33_001742 [Rhynchophorus ferrugineus]|uniref:Uncharacterized protein n=1 Tax=Rhynchophorus ferrugineus TaxID=354439 RepID=A0A834MLU4_RHYFE|nr:hypothetical protein GWI33_001742 [Rhynchophorus ferrugineus]
MQSVSRSGLLYQQYYRKRTVRSKLRFIIIPIMEMSIVRIDLELAQGECCAVAVVSWNTNAKGPKASAIRATDGVLQSKCHIYFGSIRCQSPYGYDRI